MSNDIRLQEGHPVDENLRPLKVGGKSTSLETAQWGDGARINGNLEVTGDVNVRANINGNIKDMVLEDVTVDSLTTTGDIVSTNLTIDDSGSITLDADSSGLVLFKDGGSTFAKLSTTGGPYLQLYESAGGTDYCILKTATNGSTTITTADAAGTNAHLHVDIDGDITLNSATGEFIMEQGGEEFSPANSAYSGMLLGVTHVFGSGTGGQFVQISTAWANLVWDTDKFALVTFVVPPSNKVKISVHLPYVPALSYQVQLGLATDSSATTLNTKYENNVDDANRADNFNLNYSWVVEGSDHSWSAGETKTIYIMAYTSSNVRFYAGGTNTNKYGGVIVEATALPATIGDGSEP